eukprot:gene12075-5568_t
MRGFGFTHSSKTLTAEIISKTNLPYLDLSKNSFSAQDLSSNQKHYEGAIHLFKDNRVRYKDLKSLNILKVNKSLRKLKLYGSTLTMMEWRTIIDLLSTNKLLEIQTSSVLDDGYIQYLPELRKTLNSID